VLASHGSFKTQNLEDAIADAQGIASLARAAIKQMSAVWKQHRIPHRLSFLRLLQGPASLDRRSEVEAASCRLWSTNEKRLEAASTIFVLHSLG